ncbi:MACPF domain-containing protein, partial [Trifolium medium]|nr:MACPF domain-containing protein [Trifolium medium]
MKNRAVVLSFLEGFQFQMFQTLSDGSEENLLESIQMFSPWNSNNAIASKCVHGYSPMRCLKFELVENKFTQRGGELAHTADRTTLNEKTYGLHFQGTKELASIKRLAYDGWFIKRYTIELERRRYELHDHVKEAVPSTWDPEAVARFIERFGTHVIVGVSMGGKDVLYVRQDTSDLHDPASIKKLLTETASMKFRDSANTHVSASQDLRNK